MASTTFPQLLMVDVLAISKSLLDICRVLGGEGKLLRDYEATLGGEDFSFYGRAGVPAAFAFLGIRNESAGSVHGLHTPRFTLDEEVLQTGSAFLSTLAADFLASQHASGSKEEL